MEINKKSKIFKLVLEEIKKKKFGFTKQFLKVHQIEFQNGNPIIENIIKNSASEIRVFLKVRDEKFFFSVNIFKNKVIWTSDEPYFSVWFRADSKNLSLKELSSFTKLKYSFGRNKGDVRGLSNNKVLWKQSTMFYNPYPEIDELKNKIEKLLDFLEKDRKGFSKFINEADGYIDINIIYYYANSMIGNINLSKNILKRLSKLNLTINFDLEVNGNKL